MTSHKITKPNKARNQINDGHSQQCSLEHVFIEQSLNIKVKPQNKKYLKKREIHNQYPREKYRRRNKENKKHILHFPHRKLLLSQIEFLNNHIRNTKPGPYGYKLMVYAGSAKGKHIPLLIEMFTDLIIHLYDHKPFCTAVKRTQRVVIHQKYFTQNIAKEYGRMGRHILFVSNITTFDEIFNGDNRIMRERSVIHDNELQSKWVKGMSCNGYLSAAMIGFRLPYASILQISDHQKCLDGIFKMMIWAPPTATRSMLHIKPNKNGKIKDKVYSCKMYEEQLFWFNVVARQSLIDNKKYYDPKYGIMNCYDSWAECLILEQYLLYYKQVKSVTKPDVAAMLHNITKFFDSSDDEQKENVLGIANYSYNLNHTKHHGILTLDSNQNKKVIQQIEEYIQYKMVDISCVNSVKICKYEWSALPCYNLPIYNLIFIQNNLYLIPLNGCDDNISLKVNPVYSTFYYKCLGNMASYCCLTGFLIDNNGMENKRAVRYELRIIDILSPNSLNDYHKRKERIKCIINNYEKYKYNVTECDVFKFIPIKLSECPSESGGERNVQSFRNKILTNIPSDDKELIAPKPDETMRLQWNDMYFDRKKHKNPAKGWYFKTIEVNSRIGGVLWIKNSNRNILFSDETAIGVDVIDIDLLL